MNFLSETKTKQFSKKAVCSDYIKHDHVTRQPQKSLANKYLCFASKSKLFCLYSTLSHLSHTIMSALKHKFDHIPARDSYKVALK